MTRATGNAGGKRHELARSLEHRRALPVERVLCSHGEPILGDARAILAAAIAEAALPPA